jgi:hypothetical protein
LSIIVPLIQSLQMKCMLSNTVLSTTKLIQSIATIAVHKRKNTFIINEKSNDDDEKEDWSVSSLCKSYLLMMKETDNEGDQGIDATLIQWIIKMSDNIHSIVISSNPNHRHRRQMTCFYMWCSNIYCASFAMNKSKERLQKLIRTLKEQT